MSFIEPKSNIDIRAIVKERGIFQVPEELQEVAWEEDSDFVLHECRKDEKALRYGVHAIPDLLASLFYKDHCHMWNSDEFRMAVAGGRNSLYKYLHSLIDGNRGKARSFWSISFRTDIKPMAAHLENIFPGFSQKAMLFYSNPDEMIDLRFSLDDVMAVYLFCQFTWSTDARCKTFWCSHFVAWMSHDELAILEDFCIGFSRDFVCGGDKNESTSRLLITASGRIMTTSSRPCLLHPSESGSIRPKIVSPGKETPTMVRMHQAVAMVKYDIRKSDLSAWFQNDGLSIDHLSRDVAYSGINHIVMASWEDQCDNKAILDDVKEIFVSLENLGVGGELKQAITSEEGWRRCRVRTDVYTMSHLAECLRRKEVVETCLVECKQPLWYHPTFACLRLGVGSFKYLMVTDLSHICFPEISSYFVRSPAVFGRPIHHLVHDTMYSGNSITLVGEGDDGEFHIYVIDHVSNDPTNTSHVQMLTMSQNTTKECGIGVVLCLLNPQSSEYVTLAMESKRATAIAIKQHFAYYEKEDRVAADISKVSTESMYSNWLVKRAKIPENFERHIKIIHMEDQEYTYKPNVDPLYKILYRENKESLTYVFARGRKSMDDMVLRITGEESLPDKFIESAWIFKHRPEYRTEIFQTLGNMSLVDIQYAFGKCPGVVSSKFIVEDQKKKDSEIVSGYAGIVAFILSRDESLESKQDKARWRLMIKLVLDSNQEKLLFGRFRITRESGSFVHTKQYGVSFPGDSKHTVQEGLDRDDMVNLLKRTVHADISYPMVTSLVNARPADAKENRIREDIHEAFKKSGVVITGISRNDTSNKNDKKKTQRSYTSYFVVKNEPSLISSSYTFVDSTHAQLLDSSAPRHIKEGLASGNLLMIEMKNGNERDQFVEKHASGNMKRLLSSDTHESTATINDRLSQEDGLVQRFISGHPKSQMAKQTQVFKCLAFVVEYLSGSTQEVHYLSEMLQTITAFLGHKINDCPEVSPSSLKVIAGDNDWVTFEYEPNVRGMPKAKYPRNQNLSHMMVRFGLKPVTRATKEKGVHVHSSNKEWLYKPSTANDEIPFMYKRTSGKKYFILVTQKI